MYLQKDTHASYKQEKEKDNLSPLTRTRSRDRTGTNCFIGV